MTSPLRTEYLNNASAEDLAAIAAECLSRLEPGRQPLPLFVQLGRLMVLSTFEVTPFRSSRNSTEVLLAQRSESDLWWPSQWHLPGAVQLPTGKPGIRSYEDAADDLLRAEFSDTVERTGPVAIFDAQLRSGSRGSEQTVFGWADVELSAPDIAPYGGRFFDVHSLLSEPPAEGLIGGHDRTIQKALAHYALQRG